MDPKKNKDDGILLPILYALLASIGVFNLILVAGIVWTYFHPPVQANPAEPTQTQISMGPRTALSTHTPRDETGGAQPSPVEEQTPEESPQRTEAPSSEAQVQEPGSGTGQAEAPPPASRDNAKPADETPAAASSPSRPASTSNGNEREPRSSNSSGDWENGKVLGTVNGKVYHTHNCVSAQKIKEANKVWFDSPEEAQAAGRSLCKNC